MSYFFQLLGQRVRNKTFPFVVYLMTSLKLRGIMTHKCLFLSIKYKEGLMCWYNTCGKDM